MSLNFEINVQCKGNAVGTLGWLNSLLSDGELIIKENRDGIPSLFFHEFHDKNGKERAKNEGNHFIAKVSTKDELINSNPEQYINEDLFGENILRYVVPQDNQHQTGFVDCALTPAAYDKLDQFIYEAKEKYKEWWMSENK
ncbi:MAG: hypothetical protein ACOC22_03110 [bacterium]